MDKLRKAERRCEEIDRKLRETEISLDAALSDAVSAFKERWLKEHEAERHEIDKLRLALQQARADVEDAAIEADVAKTTSGPKVGEVLYEWAIRSFGYKTGRVGKRDIWTPESAYPAGSRWGLPAAGEFYIRILKKDGSESQRFERIWAGSDTGIWANWLPEGKVRR